MKSAITSGYYLIVASALLVVVTPLLHFIENTTVTMAILFTMYAFYFAAFCIHIWNYASLGAVLNSTLMIRAAKTSAVLLMLLGGTLIASLYAYVGQADYNFTSNIALIVAITLLIIPSILFAVATLAQYRKFGPVVVPVAALVPISIFTFWQPWPTFILAGASVYMLIRAERLFQ